MRIVTRVEYTIQDLKDMGKWEEFCNVFGLRIEAFNLHPDGFTFSLDTGEALSIGLPCFPEHKPREKLTPDGLPTTIVIQEERMPRETFQWLLTDPLAMRVKETALYQPEKITPEKETDNETH